MDQTNFIIIIIEAIVVIASLITIIVLSRSIKKMNKEMDETGHAKQLKGLKDELVRKETHHLLLFLLLLSGLLGLGKSIQVNAQDDLSRNAKSLVFIQTGFYDVNGGFYEVRRTNGYIITKTDNQILIVASNSDCQFNHEEFAGTCRKKGITTEDANEDNVILVSYEGDTRYEAYRGEDYSVEQNFCILTLGQSFDNKEVVTMEDKKSVKTGDTVYLIRYGSQDGVGIYQQLKGTALTDVVKMQGHDGEFIKFKLDDEQPVSDGYLVNEEGHVVGLVREEFNNPEAPSEGYVICNRGITSILDNQNIPYKTHAQQAALDNLSKLAEDYDADVSDGKLYKSGESLESFKNKISEAKELTKNEYLDQKTAESCADELESMEKDLPRKMEKERKIQLILGILLAILLPMLISKIVKYVKTRKRYHKFQQDLRSMESNRGRTYSNVRGNPVEREKKPVNREPSHLYLPNGQKYYLQAGKSHIKIGRVHGVNDIVIEDQAVSKEHATITCSQGHYFITDHSTNGSYLNGRKVERNQTVPLTDGDRIRLGNGTIAVRLQG